MPAQLKLSAEGLLRYGSTSRKVIIGNRPAEELKNPG